MSKTTATGRRNCLLRFQSSIKYSFFKVNGSRCCFAAGIPGNNTKNDYNVLHFLHIGWAKSKPPSSRRTVVKIDNGEHELLAQSDSQNCRKRTLYKSRAVLISMCKVCEELHVKAVLSQRWPRNAPYTWVPWKFSGLPNYAHSYYSQNFSWDFVPIDPMNVPTKLEVRSFARSWDNGVTEKFGQPLDTPTLFSRTFYGLLFGLAL